MCFVQVAETHPLMSLGEALRICQQQSGTGLQGEDARVFQWHVANLEFANAAHIGTRVRAREISIPVHLLLTIDGVGLDSLSALDWNQDDGFEFLGPHCMVHFLSYCMCRV